MVAGTTGESPTLTREEQTRNIDVMNQWVAQVFQRSSKKIDADQIVPRPTAPFSFVYGGL